MNKSRIAVPAFVLLASLAAPPWSAPASAGPVTGSGPADGSRASAAGAGARKKAAVADERESVVVTGTGKVSGEPDTLTANFAVETSATTVDAALKSANTAASRMRDSLLRAGAAKADLQTTDVAITSRRDDDGEITGYTVTEGLTAKLRNLAQAGKQMSAAVAAGGDAARLNGVSFAIEDDSALLTEARRKAFADAKAKAELYAGEAGRPLGRVVKVSEETPRFFGSGDQDRMTVAMAAADSPVPIEPGVQQLSVTITVEWALKAS